jgi:hypothetical protein
MKALIILYYNLEEPNIENKNKFYIDDLDIFKNRFKNTSFYSFENNSSIIELKKIVEKINLDNSQNVIFITNKKDLFEYFNRAVFVGKYDIKIADIPLSTDNNDFYKKVNLDYSDFEYFNINSFISENDSSILKNITSIFRDYCNFFDFNIDLLTKETTYRVETKEELKQLILEDYQLLKYKHILTSRLAVIYYRLIFFDLNASSATIGRFFNDLFNTKSSPFKFNLRIPPHKYYFPSLHNKSFRGYKLVIPKQPDSEYQLKIEIAKKLLSNNVSIKIVSKSLEITEEELKNDIYFLDKKDVLKNESFYSYSDIAKNNMKRYNGDRKKSIEFKQTANSNYIIENFKKS